MPRKALAKASPRKSAKTKPAPVVRMPLVKITTSGDVTQDLDRIFSDGVLVDLRIGYWNALKRNTPEKLGLKAQEIPDDVSGIGMHRLIPKKTVDSWRTLAGHARYILERHSFVFPVGQCSFVPKDSLARVHEELTKTKTDFLKAAESAPRQMRHLFYMEWDVFNVALPRKAQLVAFDKKKHAEGEKALQRYKMQLEQRMAEFIGEVVGTMREKVIEVCVNIQEKLKSGEVITNRSLNSLRGVIERFREMNFVGDERIEGLLNRMDKELLGDRDAETYQNNDALQRELTKSLDGLVKAATAVTDVSEITGGYGRRIRV